ncbi:thioesterase II family protein [Clostridium aminobutyricum]|uniref:Thioesterase n=1 Tax=Clostridium aminobutyricum TaxID=33953 RepID=A0A939DA98_CLOAM|nr:alpha/beta fold hydrolase [Clostridium aminobutyricum]MBN7773932.1 thioesterase [Clostridium aminobutyricum]
MDAEGRARLFPYNKELGDREKHVVVCFHHAGGNGAAFRNWMKVHTGHPAEFVPVELAGHGYRRREPLLDRFNDVVRDLVDGVADLVKNRSYSFFGHSMGAALAFAVEHELEHRYHLKANKVIVAGRFAPAMEDPGHFRVSMGEEALLKEVKKLNPENSYIYENEEFVDFFLPIIRDDYALHEDYQYTGEIIHAPIVAHSGSEDVDSRYEHMKPWEEVTNGSFKIKEFQGNHFFPHNLGERYIEEILHEVLR